MQRVGEAQVVGAVSNEARDRGRERAWILLGAYCGLRSFETAKVCGADLEQAYQGREPAFQYIITTTTHPH